MTCVEAFQSTHTMLGFIAGACLFLMWREIWRNG